MLLLVLVLSLLLSLLILKESETRLRADLARYRNPASEAIADLIDRPLALAYPDGASLAQFLKGIRLRSTGQPRLATGIPIYVDPIGLSETEQTMASVVKKPPADRTLTLREHLTRVLKPLGLGFVIKDGFLMITSEESLDEEIDDPYLGFRDVLQ
jgi:hypothetical protein